MSPARWRQVEEVCDSALRLAPARRAAFVKEACAGDEKLRREVESLLAGDERARVFLETPALELDSGLLARYREEAPPPGRMLHYEIVDKLGEGGMGAVYKARDTHLDRFVALKFLPAEKVADPDRKRRFVEEAKAASALNHPNIVTIHDIASEDGRDVIVMEYVEGKTLTELIGRKGLPVAEALRLAIPMADALAAVHDAGIVHRDLKPANVMVTDKGQVKVLDFGLAKLAERPPVGESAPRTETGTILGTVAYMSPEQAEGKKVDARSDIFSFGSVLYEMLTGHRAFERDPTASTLAAILKEEPKPARELAGGLPPELDRIVARCLRKDPERRFQHMGDVKAALADLSDEISHADLVPAPLVAPPPGRKRWLPLAAAILAVLGAGVWFLPFGSKPPETAMRVVPLTSYPGQELCPSLSPDGRQVAFAWNGEREDNYDIYVKLVNGGPHIRLTTDAAIDFDPAWSPDGSRIAFYRTGKDHSDVLVIPALGGPEQRVGEVAPVPWSLIGALVTLGLAWSPDGKNLAVTDANGIAFLSLETGKKEPLASEPNWAGRPVFSPDGGNLAFLASGNGPETAIYVQAIGPGMKAHGGPRLILRTPWIFGLAWTSDSRALVYSLSSEYQLTFDLWRIEASGGKPERLSTPGPGWLPSVSAKGNLLVYAQPEVDTNLYRLDLAGAEGKVNRPIKIASSSRIEDEPVVSSDGAKVVFTSYRSGTSEAWICNSDGSNCYVPAFPGITSVRGLRWSPDGRRVAFFGKTGGSALYVGDFSGGAPRKLAADAGGLPAWSRDGR